MTIPLGPLRKIGPSVVELSVVQRAPGSADVSPGEAVWRTCLREIAFVGDASPEHLQGDLLEGEDAYAHLLAVVCGLHSPIVGETEVMHQFKRFLAELPPSHAGLGPLGQRLLADARLVRTEYLIGLGSRSYGSVVRRHLRHASRVALIGTGMLAREILPFAHDEGRQVDVWGRRETFDLAGGGVTYRRLSDPAVPRGLEGAVVMVVAAPVSSVLIRDLTRRYTSVVRLVDLRAEGADDPPPAVAPVVALADVFAEVGRAAASTERRVAAAREAIRRCARAYASREKLRPSGWHDLCA
jgi:glutamyl-tRNA reductase